MLSSTGSCLTLSYVALIARMWNMSHPEDQVRVDASKRDMLRSLKAKTGLEEYMFDRLDFLPGGLASEVSAAFRPRQPASWVRNEYEWLNTGNIENVMRQYEAKYRSFKFMGVHPIDYDTIRNGKCIVSDICQLNVAELLAAGKTRVGFVFNLDRHDQPGSHWVALHCGLDPKRKMFGVYYYDSVAKPPPKQVKDLMRRVSSQVAGVWNKQAANKFQADHNRVRRQFKNTECGLFSMHFLISCLSSNRDFSQVCESMGSDEEVHMLRNMLYRPPLQGSSKDSLKIRSRRKR
jgi:hypothetical protein